MGRVRMWILYMGVGTGTLKPDPLPSLGGGDGEGGLERFSRGHPRCSQAKGSKVEEMLVHLRMEVKFEVLIEKKKMYYLGLRWFDLWMEFLMVHLEELEMKIEEIVCSKREVLARV
ncbi:hypothetical protein Tco_0102666 [Tanacetum coccineum]